jgi:putative Holliday junction resolvase
MKDSGRIIAIDYGNRRTGLAVTDPGQLIATPLDTVPTHELMHFLEHYMLKESVEVIVVGHPRKPDHTDSDVMKQIRFFVQAFKKRFAGVRVEWMDERYTSRMAEAALRAGGMKKQDRRLKENVDKVSAALILQSYLELRNNMNDQVL